MESNTQSSKVSNLVYCNKNKQIVEFLKFSDPIPKNEVRPEELYKEKYSYVIITLEDGTGYKYIPEKLVKCAA